MGKKNKKRPSFGVVTSDLDKWTKSTKKWKKG
jgi:hypothetical protein